MEQTDYMEDTLGNKLWRMNNLYWILDKKARRVKFRMNSAQVKLFENMHTRNVVLKARQRGITTLICLYFLDEALFHDNVEACIIAHKTDDAQKIFRRKIKYPYDNLPDTLKKARTLKTDSKSELHFAQNNSTLFVTTGARSGTVQYLHISEFAKICRDHPRVADEILTGSFPAVPSDDGMIFVESTSAGSYGHFFDMCNESRKPKLFTPLDFRFHFFSWWDAPEYEMDPAGVVISSEDEQYFEELEIRLGIELSDRKRAWYCKTAVHYRKKDDNLMFQEFPSTPEEAFQKQIHGAYYAKLLLALRREKKITNVPYDPAYPVNTGWDMGVADQTEIVFHQKVLQEHRIIDYYSNNGEPLRHYADILAKKGYVYGTHFLPHDASARRQGIDTLKTAFDYLHELMPGQYFDIVPKTNSVADSIESVRALLPLCWFDEKRCGRLVTALSEYQKEWNETLGCFRQRPLDNWTSHPADAFRTLTEGLSFYGGVRGKKTLRRRPSVGAMAI